MARSRQYPLSRRSLLGGALGLGLGTGLLAACSIDTGGGGGAATADGLEFPDLGTDLPSEAVTFRWVDSGDLKSVFVSAVLEAFHAKHDNITVSYDGSGWDTISQVVPLGIRNGTAHDVFQVPNEVPAQVAVNEGWVRPLDDLIPDFESWRADFGDTALIPGVHVFDGKVYTFPLSSAKRLDRMLFFDAEVAREAGLDDPVGSVRTWDDLRTAATKIRDSGRVGLALAGDNIANLLIFLALGAGWKANTSGMDMSTGEYVFDAPEMIQAVQFLQSMIDDKLVTPGFLTVLEKDARTQMTAGTAGMILNGPWDIPAWKRAAPDWEYLMAAPPTPQGESFTVPFREAGANQAFVYAKTALPTVAGQIMAYMGSVQGQSEMVSLSEGNLRSVIPDANAAADSDQLDGNARTAARLADEVMRRSPMVELRNPDAGQVTLATRPVTPNLVETLQGIFSGALDDVRGELTRYSSAMNTALDEAIASAAGKGSSVTRADYAFRNWDPRRDYTAADYEAL